ncbi:neuromodulin-like isoform X3 [Agrilus planipennis]|uniref:Neuromodulin-like isoform X3 n=1 Tax=Agrilus planipennis TaxID=224129 RepID=A0A1W4XI47_AGRPL|nr:neuromodulin-like isoform X3 [Agrilus planipennis]
MLIPKNIPQVMRLLTPEFYSVINIAAKVVQSLTEIALTIVNLLVNIGMTREEADRTASIIQKIFRQYLEEKKTYQKEISDQIEEANLLTDIITEAGITPDQAEAAAEIIQRAWRDFKRKHEREKYLLSGIIDWRIAARSAIRLYRSTGVTYEEANRAATMIKAAYKGYYTRRMIKKLLEESQRLSETPSLASMKSVESEEEEEGEFYWDMELFSKSERTTERSERHEYLEGQGEMEEELPYEVPSGILAAREIISDIIRATVPTPEESLEAAEESYMDQEQPSAPEVTIDETTEAELPQEAPAEAPAPPAEETEAPAPAEEPQPAQEEPQAQPAEEPPSESEEA